MKKYLFTIIGLAYSLVLMAQDEGRHYCGTVSERSVWLKEFQSREKDLTKSEDTLMYVPLALHLVGTSSGENYISMEKVLEGMCGLDEYFTEAEMRFYIEDIRYIDNSDWFSHDDIPTGAEMMFENNIEGVINCYFVAKASSSNTTGYNLPYAGVAMTNGFTDRNISVWSHEIGHALSLPHPFLGWEGGVSYTGDPNPPAYDFSEPAPMEVYYDYTHFQDQLYTDTLIIDTALVETVDGSNCHIAADGFCDTKPDYLALGGWNCDDEGNSLTEQTDPNGVKFRSGGNLIMSYASENCQYRFTPEQIAAMRANINEEKPYLLRNALEVLPEITATPEPIFPLEEEVTNPFLTLEWEAVEHADRYVVQVSRVASFPAIVTEEYLTATTFVDVEGLRENTTYYWRIRPFNAFSTCTEFSEDIKFETTTATSTQELEEKRWTIFPNIVASGSSFSLESTSTLGKDINMSWYDLTGRFLESKQLANSMVQEVQVPQLARGVYFLNIEMEGRIHTQKMIIQ